MVIWKSAIASISLYHNVCDSNICRVDPVTIPIKLQGNVWQPTVFERRPWSQTVTTWFLRCGLNAFLRVGNMFGGTRAGKESCSMPSFLTFCSHLGNMSFNQLCGRFLTFSLSAKCKVEWREAAQRMIDEERRQWAQWTDSGRFLFQGHLLYSYPLAFEITSVHDKAVRKNWMSSLLIALFFKLMVITTFHVGFRMF